MRTFAVKDEDDRTGKILAYLLYYEKEKVFYIELPEDADYWETPLLLASCLKDGEKTVNAHWSRLWVEQRIIPADRQNIGQILKENHLKEYDEFQLLLLGKGRCAQDNYYIEEIPQEQVFQKFPDRFLIKVEDAMPLLQFCLLIFFRDGSVKRCDMKKILEGERSFAPILFREDLFDRVQVQAGGYGICWGENLLVADRILYDRGEKLDLSGEDFRRFAISGIINAREAAEFLGCSRQNINDLIKRGQLHPIKADSKNTLFFRSEVVQRQWK